MPSGPSMLVEYEMGDAGLEIPVDHGEGGKVEGGMREHDHPDAASCRENRAVNEANDGSPPEKPQGSLILGRPFSVVAESRLRVSPRHRPFYCRFQ